MIIDQRARLAAPIENVWAFVMDIPAVGTCVPGVEHVYEIGPDTFGGILAVRVGPIGLRLEGQVRIVERDREQWRSRMDVDATDKRIRGAVRARTTMQLSPTPDGQTDLDIHTDAAILGKLGQFGQAVIRKKADQILAAFASTGVSI